MDRKSFLSGVAVGGLVVAVIWALQPDRQPPELASDTAAPVASSAPDAERPASVNASAATEPESDAPIPTAESPANNSQVASSAPQLNWIEARRAALDSEPRDESWSYFTEQAVEQYLARHADISGFTVDFIECRSTICQIGVEGFNESTGPIWQQILLDMRQQPWYEFGQVGTSTGNVDGRLKTITEFKRLASN